TSPTVPTCSSPLGLPGASARCLSDILACPADRFPARPRISLHPCCPPTHRRQPAAATPDSLPERWRECVPRSSGCPTKPQPQRDRLLESHWQPAQAMDHCCRCKWYIHTLLDESRFFPNQTIDRCPLNTQ